LPLSDTLDYCIIRPSIDQPIPFLLSFVLLHTHAVPYYLNLPPGKTAGAGDVGPERQPILNMLLRSELLGVDLHRPYSRPSCSSSSESKDHHDDRAGGGGLDSSAADGRGTGSSSSSTSGTDGTGSSSSIGRPAGGEGGPGCLQRRSSSSSSSSSSSPNILQFKPARERHSEEVHRSFSLLPMGPAQRRLLSTPLKAKRKVSKVPFKVLDAPALQDDFYLNLVDWSSLNVLAVGLGTCVYLWSACTSSVTKLCDLGEDDSVTSVAWTQRGTHLAVGTNTGEIQMWDVGRCQRIRSLSSHSARIGTMSWNGQLLASGSRDRMIYLRDVRAREPSVKKLQGHRQEVCGLKWSFDDCQLASGGNDNKLYIWTLHSSQPVQKFTEHTAAVKALAWSPHQGGLLASGGGTADRHIRFWNTLTGASLNRVDTGSQVCNLMWSKNVNEIVSTHGYSLNQIILWRYPSMTKVTTLTGHTFRVLYLAMSPDGQTIVTGAGDETLRFWNVFPGAKSTGGDGSRLGTTFLFPVGHNIR
jgi:cell division cycle 20-like protein 1 (cofactor of APC complex)